MEQTLRQLGELLLAAIPTIICLLVVFAAYTVIVHKPLQRVLEERRSRTEGAVEQARADVATAGDKAAEYEQRLREAKVALFKAQEARRQKALQARAAAIAAAREQAGGQVKAARATLEKDVTQAKIGLQGETERLAAEVIRAVLKPVSGSGAAAAGSQS